MIASLPMYDRPETRGANDRLWERVRQEIGIGPTVLTRGGDPWDDWQSDALILSQTCGLPYRLSLHKTVHLVATPDHGLENCPPGTYRSALVMRKDSARPGADLSAPGFAFNARDSQSGWAAPWQYAQSRGQKLRPTLETGSHLASARAVAMGDADLAAIDAVTWKMICQWDDFAPGLCVVGWTDPTPALPLITRHSDLVGPLRSALDRAISMLSGADRDVLQIFGFVTIPKDRYMALAIPPMVDAPPK